MKRSYEDFRVLDKHLHLCIYDRRFSQLAELPRSDALKDSPEVRAPWAPRAPPSPGARPGVTSGEVCWVQGQFHRGGAVKHWRWLPGAVVEPVSLGVFTSVWMWHVGTWFSWWTQRSFPASAIPCFSGTQSILTEYCVYILVLYTSIVL